jgi:hypothetical protein
MSVQAMVAQADAEANGDPMQRESDEKRSPTETKESGYGADMKKQQCQGSRPVDLLLGGNSNSVFTHKNPRRIICRASPKLPATPTTNCKSCVISVG